MRPEELGTEKKVSVTVSQCAAGRMAGDEGRYGRAGSGGPEA